MTNDKPLEILPWGRTAADQAKIDRNKARARKAVKLFLAQLAVVSIVAAYCIGWKDGRDYASVNVSAVEHRK